MRIGSICTGLWISVALALPSCCQANGEEEHNPAMFGLQVLGLVRPKDIIIPQKEIFVIGAGYARTGTKSTKKALSMLGYRAFHMEDIQSQGLAPFFVKALTSDAMMDAFIQKILDLGFNATLDTPNNLLAVELYKRFPNAKVLFNIRDTPEGWAKSYHHLHSQFIQAFGPPFSFFLDFSFTLLAQIKVGNRPLEAKPCEPSIWTILMPWWTCLQVKNTEKEFVEDFYTFQAYVEKNIPADHIFYYNVKEGWGPLEKMTGVKAPNAPFPNINESDSLKAINTILITISIIWPFVVGFLLFVFIVIIRKVTDPFFAKH